MRRSLPVIALSLAACLAVASPASATGPGGWNHLGTNGLTPPGPALNGHVVEMYLTQGVMYVGGTFTDAGGNPNADRIAVWNGSSWSAIGSAAIANGSVQAIAWHDGKVYVGGNFTDVGGDVTADYLAVWDGVTWAPFCKATAGAAFGLQVNALEVIGDVLYVGGSFQNANGVAAADYLIACSLQNGAMTPTVDGGSDFTGAIYDLASTIDGTLYAGGTFGNLDGTGADRVAYYDGTWHPLGTTEFTGIVRDLHANGMDVYVSTDSVDIGDARSDHLVKWDGTSYSPVGSDTAGTNGYFPATAYINELTTSGSLLFAAGSWQDANGDPTGDMIAFFDGTRWRPVGSNGAGGGPWTGDTQALAVYGGQVYAGGAMSNAGGDPLANLAASRSLRLPDARIGTAAVGPFVGNNVYNATAAGQTTTLSVARGTARNAFVDVQNDGLAAASFKLKGTGAATGYTVSYFSGATNVTTAVRDGTFSTPTIAPGGRFSLKLRVTLSASAASTGSFLVTATSTPNTPKDAVKAKINAT